MAPSNAHQPSLLSLQDCLGALDGAHIIASILEDETIKFRSGRSNKITQNILAACSFDFKFTCILAGWDGTARDQKNLDDDRHRLNPFVILHVDAAFTLEPGVLPQFCNTRYHLNGQKGHKPSNYKEIFNKRHATLKNLIKRAFGVFKKRWRILLGESFYPFKTQVKIAMACFVLHNHVLGVDSNNPFIQQVDRKLQLSEKDTNGEQENPPRSSRKYSFSGMDSIDTDNDIGDDDTLKLDSASMTTSSACKRSGVHGKNAKNDDKVKHVLYSLYSCLEDMKSSIDPVKRASNI
ncbi:hypothetical protein GIB67_025598 [Kingdonia uniflora]|uniref:DDE Tnp4 domain-containing protein n=1 Tax=Kingdonia uniflora TaxID=39325 RepID=A0A7J7M0H9_9MAGN|nr:hypothetical protein GIB67_025598 [Kingdonia uniflora]